METLSLGMDLHKNFSWMTVVDPKGSVLHREKVDNTMEAMEAFFGNYDSERCEVAVEATWNWYWVYELLEQMNFPVHLVHAERARAIASAKIKTDKIDSEILAQLLRMNYLPEAHIASREARHRRERLRYRVFLIRLRTMLKHSIDRFPNAKSFVSYTGLAPSLHSSGTVHRTGSITKKGNKWLRWILIEAAQHATQKRSPFFLHYQEVKRRKGAGKAVTALAAKLARLVYQTLKKQEAFNIDLYRNKKNKSSQVQGREPVGVMVAS